MIVTEKNTEKNKQPNCKFFKNVKFIRLRITIRLKPQYGELFLNTRFVERSVPSFGSHFLWYEVKT